MTTQYREFTVATLVNWNDQQRTQKLAKTIRKTLAKLQGARSPKVNRMNTFMVASVDFASTPTTAERKELEDNIKDQLGSYARGVNETLRKVLRKRSNTLRRDIKTRRASEDQWLISAVERYESASMEQEELVEKRIEEIVTQSSIMIWDMLGAEGDRLVLPSLVADFHDVPSGNEDLSVMIDELLITNLARDFLPFCAELLDTADKQYTKLQMLLERLPAGTGVPPELLSVLTNFVGQVSGLQESLKLLHREIHMMSLVTSEATAALREMPSIPLQKWASEYDPALGELATKLHNELKETIALMKPALKGLLNGTGEFPRDKVEDFVDCVIEIRGVSAALRTWVNTFKEIPSFTIMADGIAYEILEGEDYSPQDENALLEAQKLFKTYTRGGSTIYALRNAHATIQPGEFVIIRGPSGSGKTTLLNMLAGLDQPSRGAVFLSGEDIVNMNDSHRTKLRRKNFAFIFQNYALIPHLTAFENAKLPRELGGSTEESRSDINAILKGVGIGEFSTHKPALLSGGQMQRLGIARALVGTPKILFADEPTGDLDVATGRTIMQLLKKYHEETGITIVLVTHDEEVAKYGTREIFLQDGQIVEQLS